MGEVGGVSRLIEKLEPSLAGEGGDFFSGVGRETDSLDQCGKFGSGDGLKFAEGGAAVGILFPSTICKSGDPEESDAESK